MPYPANTFVDMLQSGQATVIVKPREKPEYTVQLPQRLLITNSAYLERALSSEWQASKQGGAMVVDGNERLPTVELEVQTARAFNILTFYLYRQELPAVVDDEAPAGGDDGTDLNVKSRSLVRDWLEVWLLFDLLLMPVQQNEAMTKLCGLVIQNLKEDKLISSDDVKLVAKFQHPQLVSFLVETVMLRTEKGTWTADQAREVMEAHGMMSSFLGCVFTSMRTTGEGSNIKWWTKGDHDNALRKTEGRPG